MPIAIRKSMTLVATGILLHVGEATVPAQAPPQIDQTALARNALSADERLRRSAVDEAVRLGAARISPALRTALITALERQGQIHQLRSTAAKRGVQPPALEDPELIGPLSGIVAEFKDVRAIPGLVGCLGLGNASYHALTAFRSAAVAPVVSVLESKDAGYEQLNGALIATRMLVEVMGNNAISPPMFRRIRELTEHHLRGPGEPPGTGITVRWAIDLAVVTGDSTLIAIVDRISTDRREVEARGLSDPQLIEQTMQRARDRLAGIPALPRPRTSGG
jgi:hypothetical protein